MQRFRISQIVFGILKEFCYVSGTSRKSEIEFVEISKLSSNKLSKVLNSSHEVSNDSRNSFRKSQKVLGIFKHFLEVSKSCRKSEKVSEALNIFRKFQTVFGNLKQFAAVSMSCWGSKTILRIFKKFSVLSKSVCTAITRCARKIDTLSQNSY